MGHRSRSQAGKRVFERDDGIRCGGQGAGFRRGHAGIVRAIHAFVTDVRHEILLVGLLAFVACGSERPGAALSAPKAASPQLAKTASPDTGASGPRRKPDCIKGTKGASGFCAATTAFEGGTPIRETALHGRRFIDVGYVTQPAGPTVRQLIVVEYSFTANFHQEVHYPNRICALFVRADSESEIRSLDASLDTLEHGSVPVDSSAYAWAIGFSLHTNDDCFAARRAQDGTLVAEEAGWSLRESGEGVAFVAQDWQGKPGATLRFKSEHEVSQVNAEER